MKPPLNVCPTVILKMSAIINASPSKTAWITYSIGATNKKLNSKGSVIPVKNDVNAADNIKPPTTFLRSGFAV